MPLPQPIATSAIVSQAFRFLEKSPISSLDDDTEEAQAAIEQYQTALETCLDPCDWSFASTLVALSLAAPDPMAATDPALPYRYSLPGDVLKVREVEPDCPRPPRWRQDRNGLHCAQPAPLLVRYTSRFISESQAPAQFRTAVALRLAWLLGPRWLVASPRLADLDQQATAKLGEAMRADARTASEARYDGRADQGWWADEATQ